MTGPATDLTVSCGADGVIVHWGDGLEALLGWPVAAAVGRPVDLIVPPDQRTRHREGLSRVAGGGEPHLDGATVNLPVLGADGQVRAVPARFVLLRDPFGVFVGATAVFGTPTGDEEPWTAVTRPADERP